MSLFNQTTHLTTNNLKPTWYTNNKNIKFNTKAKIKLWSNFFSNDRMLKGSILSSNHILTTKLNNVVDIDPLANLYVSHDINKINSYLNYNHQDTTYIK